MRTETCSSWCMLKHYCDFYKVCASVGLQTSNCIIIHGTGNVTFQKSPWRSPLFLLSSGQHIFIRHMIFCVFCGNVFWPKLATPNCIAISLFAVHSGCSSHICSSSYVIEFTVCQQNVVRWWHGTAETGSVVMTLQNCTEKLNQAVLCLPNRLDTLTYLNPT